LHTTSIGLRKRFCNSITSSGVVGFRKSPASIIGSTRAKWVGRLRARYRFAPGRRSPAGLHWLARLRTPAASYVLRSIAGSTYAPRTYLLHAVNHWHAAPPLTLRRDTAPFRPAASRIRPQAGPRSISTPGRRASQMPLATSLIHRTAHHDTRSLRLHVLTERSHRGEESRVTRDFTFRRTVDERSTNRSTRHHEFRELARVLRQNHIRTETHRLIAGDAMRLPAARPEPAPDFAMTVRRPMARPEPPAPAVPPIHPPARSPEAPSAPAPALDVNSLADQVFRQIDRRLTAQRERMGRV
jgi:hypothetical protein